MQRPGAVAPGHRVRALLLVRQKYSPHRAREVSNSVRGRGRRASGRPRVALGHPGRGIRDRRSRAESQQRFASDLPGQDEGLGRDGRDRHPVRLLLQTRGLVVRPPRTSGPETMPQRAGRAAGSSIPAPVPAREPLPARVPLPGREPLPARAEPCPHSGAHRQGTARPTLGEQAVPARKAAGPGQDELPGSHQDPGLGERPGLCECS